MLVAVGLKSEPPIRPATVNTSANTQNAFFALGGCILYAFSTAAEMLDFGFHANPAAAGFLQIWPPSSGAKLWNRAWAIDDNEAHYLISALFTTVTAASDSWTP